MHKNIFFKISFWSTLWVLFFPHILDAQNLYNPMSNFLVEFPLQSPLTGLTDRQEKIIESLKRNRPKFDLITIEFLKQELLLYKPAVIGPNQDLSMYEFYTLVNHIADLTKITDDWHQLKIDFEKNVVNEIPEKGKEIFYNRASNSMASILIEKRLNCATGTTYFHALSRMRLGEKKYRSGNPVLIFTPGHVLPGYMIKRDTHWELVGIETTVEGRGEIQFGPVADLPNIGQGAYRIVDADLWMTVSVLSSKLEFESDFPHSMLARTNLRYGNEIPIGQLETNINRLKQEDTGNDNSDEEKSKRSRNFLLGFGKSDVPNGDIKRPHIDLLDRPPTGGRVPPPSESPTRMATTPKPPSPSELKTTTTTIPPPAEYKGKLKIALSRVSLDNGKSYIVLDNEDTKNQLNAALFKNQECRDLYGSTLYYTLEDNILTVTLNGQTRNRISVYINKLSIDEHVSEYDQVGIFNVEVYLSSVGLDTCNINLLMKDTALTFTPN